MAERWLSVDEISADLGVNPDTICKWITRKSVPARRVGRLWKFPAREVNAFGRRRKWVTTMTQMFPRLFNRHGPH